MLLVLAIAEGNIVEDAGFELRYLFFKQRELIERLRQLFGCVPIQFIRVCISTLFEFCGGFFLLCLNFSFNFVEL
jgi:hypothetical protein